MEFRMLASLPCIVPHCIVTIIPYFPYALRVSFLAHDIYVALALFPS
jgi:hypothetical protein